MAAFEPAAVSDLVFNRGVIKIFDFTEAKKAALGIPLTWWNTEVTNAHERWLTAWETYQDPDIRNKLITAEKNDARLAYQPLVSRTIEFLRGNVLVTDAQERELDIYLEPHTSTPIPATTKMPEIHVELDIIRRITGFFRIAGEEGKGKPEGVSSIEMAWDIRDKKPDTVDDLIHKNLDLYTRNAFVLEFEENERGRMVFMAARYVMRSSKSGYGPWGEITFAFIP
jgi:hypothetical protein